MQTFGQLQAEEWKKTLEAAYGDMLEYFNFKDVAQDEYERFCEAYEDATEIAESLADLEDDDLYDGIEMLCRACRELNRLRDSMDD